MDNLLTQHAIERGAERVGLNQSSIQRLAERAWNDGLCAKDATGSLRRFMDKRLLQYRSGTIRIYGEFVYAFDRSTRRLITVFQVPRSLRKAAKKLLARKQSSQESNSET